MEYFQTNFSIWKSKPQQHEKTAFIKPSGEVKMIQSLFHQQCPNLHTMLNQAARNVITRGEPAPIKCCATA